MTLDEILKEIKKAETFVVLAHENPDGDAIGSALAVCTFLKESGKENIDVLFKEYPETFKFLPNFDTIKTEPSHEKYDIAIVVDCPNSDRVSKEYRKFIETAKISVQFDHHLRNSMFGDYNVVNPVAPACCQILVSSFEYLKIDVSKDVATCLLAGIITDTGGFRFNSTTTETFEFAAWCLSKGINVSKVYKASMMTKTKSQFNAEKLALDRLQFFGNDKITFTYITKKDIDELGVKSGELDGIAGVGVTIKDVEVAIFAREKDEGFKISFRSNNIDVADICMLFGGGGHKLAAGCQIDSKNIDEIRKAVVDETIKHLK